MTEESFNLPRSSSLRKRSSWLALLCLAIAGVAFAAPTPGAIPITGTILDETGAPLEGAQVTLHPVVREREGIALRLAGETYPGAVVRGVTDRDGRFKLDAPAPGFWTVLARAEGRVTLGHDLGPLLALPPDAAPASGRELAPVRLPPASRLEILVVDEGGTGVGGVLVEVSASTDEDGERQRFPGGWRPARTAAITDPEGRARAPVVTPGKVSVRARAGTWYGWLDLEEIPSFSPVRVALTRQRTRPARVARPDGRPAAGALVWTIWGPLGRTDADGRIDVPVTERRSHRVQVASDDGLVSSVLLKSDGETSEGPLYLTLQPPLEASGRVVDRDSRQPVEGAVVWASNEPGSALHTGPDGSFRLGLTSIPAYAELRAAAPGFALVRRPLHRDAGALPQDMVLELERAAWIEGTVVDARGQAVAGAQVGATLSADHRTGREDPLPTVWTGLGGGFLLEGLDSAHPYQIWASKNGHATAIAELPPAPRGETGRPVPPPALRMVVGEPLRLTGRVLDGDGQPIRGAEVTLVPRELLGDQNLWVSISRYTKATDAEGRFAFENPVPVASVLAVVAPGYAPLFRYEQELAPERAVTELEELILAPEAFVRGRVVDGDGRPVAGAEVRDAVASTPSFLRDLLFRHGEDEPAVTGPDGSFVLGKFAQGEPLRLVVVKIGFAPGEIWTHASREGEPVEVELRTVASISGRVLDAAGRPVARAQVSPANSGSDGGHFRWVATDESGRFEIDEAPPSRVYLEADASGHARSEPVALDLAPGEHHDGVELVLREGFVLTGRLVEPSGRPVQGVHIWARPGSSVATTDAEGRFSIPDRARGPVTLSIDREGFLPIEEEVDFAPSAPPVEILLPTAEVRGVLLTLDGAPASGRELQLLDRESDVLTSSSRQTITAADGSFRFRGVADGAYRLKLFGADMAWTGWTYPEPVVVEADRPVTGLEIREPPRVTVSGRLLGLEEEEPGAAEVLAVDEEAGLSGALGGEVLEDGRYRIDGVYPGRWYVVAFVRELGYAGAQEIEIGPEDVTVDLELVACPEMTEDRHLEARCTNPDAP